jgi:hypothetical protein
MSGGLKMSDIPDWLRDLSGGISDEEIPVEEPQDEPEPVAADPMADLMSEFEEEEEPEAAPEPLPASTASPRRSPRKKSKKGAPRLTSGQRFILSVFLFLNVIVIGLLFLAMLGRIATP